MFTGIITDIGELVTCREGRFAIRCSYPATGIPVGASIACDGACLTATEIAPAGSGSIFKVDVSNETLSRTTLGAWQPGRRINLERALRAGDELGGHIVYTGDVDGLLDASWRATSHPKGPSRWTASRSPSTRWRRTALASISSPTP